VLQNESKTKQPIGSFRTHGLSHARSQIIWPT
jgi:hypothetical protein